MAELQYVDLRHGCKHPSTAHLPTWGHRHQVIARWRCPECGQRWTYEAEFMESDHFRWKRQGRASRRWRKAEARRLAASANGGPKA